MKKFALLLFIFSLSSVSALPQAVGEILKRMETHRKALKSLRADVALHKFSVQMGGTYTKEGAVQFLPANDYFLRLDSVKPAPENFLVVKNRYLVYLPELRSANAGVMNDSLRNAYFIFPLLSSGVPKTDHVVSYKGQEKLNGTTATWLLELAPKSAASYRKIELWVDTNGMPLQSKLTENNGDWIRVLLTNLQKNVVLKSGDFKIVLPKGTNIVQN